MDVPDAPCGTPMVMIIRKCCYRLPDKCMRKEEMMVVSANGHNDPFCDSEIRKLREKFKQDDKVTKEREIQTK